DTAYATTCFFLLPSRRRHTRSKRDWSSDVCSSDLDLFTAPEGAHGRRVSTVTRSMMALPGTNHVLQSLSTMRREREQIVLVVDEIGRASCRERGGLGEEAVAQGTKAGLDGAACTR